MSIKDTLVVTATLGSRDSLQRTIDSVKNVGGERVKHIIVAPQRMCGALEDTYPNLEIISEPANCIGIYAALNYGLMKYAREYKYLTYINDDDYWLPHYSNLFQSLDRDESIDVVYGRVKYVDGSGKIIGEQTSSSRYKAFKYLLQKGIVLFTQQATLMRSELFLKIGGYDENYKLIADTNFWLRSIQEKFNFFYINSLVAAYTIQQGQLSSDRNLQNEENQILFQELGKINRFYSLLEMIVFRITNIRLYFKRLVNKRNLILIRK